MEELFFSWQHSTATPVQSFIRINLRVENGINLKRYGIFSEQIVQFNQQYDVFDTLLKFLWYIIFYSKKISTALSFFLSTQPDVRVTLRVFNRLFH